VEHGDVVADGAETPDRLLDARDVHEEIGDEDDHPAPVDQTRGLLQRFGRAGGQPRTRFVERRDDPPPLPRTGTRRDGGADAVVETYEPHGIALAQEEEAERGDESLRVGELGELRGCGLGSAGAAEGGTTPGHGLADVEDDARAEVRLLLVLSHHPAIGAGGDLPVDVAEVVAFIQKSYADEDGIVVKQLRDTCSHLLPWGSFGINGHWEKATKPEHLGMKGNDRGMELSVYEGDIGQYGRHYGKRAKVAEFIKLVDVALGRSLPSEAQGAQVEPGAVYRDASIKSLRYYQNNNLRVIFHTKEDCDKVKAAFFSEEVCQSKQV